MYLQICLICVTIVGFRLVSGVKDGLYDVQDNDVFPLNNKNFDASVLKGKRDVVWVIEFYNSWCGHCVSFAPTWKNVSKHFRDWIDMVIIAAIDCSQPVNLEICRRYEVSSYPVMKMLPPVSVRGGQIEKIASQDFQDIKKIILDFMVKNRASSWPHLEPLGKIADIWHFKKDIHEHVVLICEEEGSPVGAQVIIDLRKTPNVLVHRILKSNAVKFGITNFPSLYTVNPDSTYSVLAVYVVVVGVTDGGYGELPLASVTCENCGTKLLTEDRAAFVKKIKDLAQTGKAEDSHKARKDGQDLKQSPNKEHRENLPSNLAQHDSSVVRMQDLESALHYSLRQEVAIRKIIDGERFSALKRYVGVLAKYFPGRKPVAVFLKRVSKMLGSLKTDNITGEDWLNKINLLQDKDSFLPAVIKWESCQGSSPRYRGYPCGMWTLYHTLSVAAYNLNKVARPGNHREVLVAVRDYMKNFFGCEECSKNFQLMARTVEDDIHDHQGAVLWLWSAHNKANKRLRGDASEDPEHIKIEFPSEKICRQCRRAQVPGNGSREFTWDVKKVLEFLVNMYSESSIVSSPDLGIMKKDSHNLNSASGLLAKSGELDWWEVKQQDQDLKRIQNMQQNGEGYVNNKNSEFHLSYEEKSKMERYQFFSLWGVTRLDFSVCVIFYCITTLILFMLYRYFIVRRRMKPCKHIKSLLPL